MCQCGYGTHLPLPLLTLHLVWDRVSCLFVDALLPVADPRLADHVLTWSLETTITGSTSAISSYPLPLRKQMLRFLEQPFSSQWLGVKESWFSENLTLSLWSEKSPSWWVSYILLVLRPVTSYRRQLVQPHKHRPVTKAMATMYPEFNGPTFYL